LKKKWRAAGVLAAGCAALALFGQNNAGGADMAYALALPFVWAGLGLRALSLSGFAGNILAVLLYVLASLLPMWPLIQKSRRPKGSFLRLMLVAESTYLFFLLYFMVNPTLIQTLFHAALGVSNEMLVMDQAMLCLFFYSLLAACWIMSVLRDSDRLTHRLRQLMYVLGASMIVSVFYLGLANLKGTLSSLPASSGGSDPLGLNLGMPGMPESFPACDAVIAVLRFLIGSAPAILLLTALPMADKLLVSLEQSFFIVENQRLAAAIAGRCRLAVIVSISGMLAMGALQLLLAGYLSNVSLAGSAPILVLTVSLAMMLLSRYLERSFAVYKENQMMI
jgi:hypothetical protein